MSDTWGPTTAQPPYGAPQQPPAATAPGNYPPPAGYPHEQQPVYPQQQPVYPPQQPAQPQQPAAADVTSFSAWAASRGGVPAQPDYYPQGSAQPLAGAPAAPPEWWASTVAPTPKSGRGKKAVAISIAVILVAVGVRLWMVGWRVQDMFAANSTQTFTGTGYVYQSAEYGYTVTFPGQPKEERTDTDSQYGPQVLEDFATTKGEYTSAAQGVGFTLSADDLSTALTHMAQNTAGIDANGDPTPTTLGGADGMEIAVTTNEGPGWFAAVGQGSVYYVVGAVNVPQASWEAFKKTFALTAPQ